MGELLAGGRSAPCRPRSSLPSAAAKEPSPLFTSCDRCLYCVDPGRPCLHLRGASFSPKQSPTIVAFPALSPRPCNMPLLRHCFLLFVLLVVVHAAVDKIGTLGGPCNTIATSVPCRVVHTLCTDNVCRCAPTYRQENEKCVRNGGGSSLGRPCASTTDCSGEGEYCSSYARCMCMSTHIELNSLCRPVIYPGQSGCEDGRQCAKAFPGATCNKERVCQCPDGLTAEGQTCVHSSSLVPIVLADSLPLPLPIPFDLGRSNQRQHRTSQVYWADQRERQNVPSSVPPGGICSGDPDCNGYPHAYCSGTCMCRSGAFNAGSTCVESVVAPGARNCTYNKQCTEAYREAMCFLQQCTCPPLMPVAVDGTCGRNCSAGDTYSGVLGRCIATVKPGDQCLYSSQCHALSPGMICDRGSCRCPNSQAWTGSACSTVCPRGYILNSKGLCNPAEARPLQSCINGELCTGGSFCSNGNCTCPVGTSVLNAQCVTPITVPPLSPCNPSVQCGGNSFCLAGICSCPQNQQPIQDQCQLPPAVSPGSRCPSGLERCIGGSTCIGSICTCPFGTVIRLGECQPIQQVTPGSPCDNQLLRCTGLSVCVFNRCQLSACSFYPWTSSSLSLLRRALCSLLLQLVVGVGGDCRDLLSECGYGSVCQMGRCNCPDGWIVRSERCIIRRTALPGESCADGQECAQGTFCDDRSERAVCSCYAHDHIVVGKKCVEALRSPPGYPCSNREVCIGGSQCIDGTCQCEKHQTIIDRQCMMKPRVVPGGICGVKESICLGRSECDPVKRRCVCPRHFVIREGACEMAARVAPGKACRPSYDICQMGSRCIGNVCQCSAGQMPIGERCAPIPQVMPGGSCARGEICLDRAECREGRCVCLSGRIIRLDRCVVPPRVRPGMSCDEGDVCIGDSTCIRGICSCAENKIIRRDRCISRSHVRVGYLCHEEDTCSGNSTCINVGPEERCDRGEICTGGSTCINFICTCTLGLVRRGDQCMTPAPAAPGMSCDRGERCVGGSTCIGGVCRCSGDQVIRSNFCTEPLTARPMEKKLNIRGGNGGTFVCNLDDDCTGGAFCNSKVCVCPGKLLMVDGKCRASTEKAKLSLARPGEPCTPLEKCSGDAICVQGLSRTDAQCVSNNQCASGAECVEGRCHCPIGTELTRFGFCMPHSTVPPGADCVNGERCGGGSSCISRTCACPPGLSAIVNNICVPPSSVQKSVVDPGRQCREDQDFCGGGAECIASLCHCQPGWVVHGSTCAQLIMGAGRECTTEANCAGGSVCKNGVCQCPSGLVQADAECVRGSGKAASPGASCLFDAAACTGGSFCRSGVCVCATGSAISNGQCVINTRYVAPGGACISGDPTLQCTGNSVCAGNAATQFCTCPSGEIVRNGQCVTQEFTANPGEPCIPTTTQCLGNSFCIGGLCSCTSNQLPMGNQCTTTRTTVYPNYACDASSMCVGNSMCIGGVCQCPPGQSPVNNQCQSTTSTVVGNPGTACDIYASSPTTCRGGAVCVRNICVCPSTLVIAGERCVPFAGAANPGESCAIEGIICQGGSTCVNNVCRCTFGFMPVGQLCVAVNNPPTTPQPSIILNPGETCDERCTPSTCLQRCGGGSICSDNICTCPAGYSAINGACVIATNSPTPPVIPTAYPSQQCVSRTLCLGGSSCILGICRCPSDQTPNPDTRSCVLSGSGAADIVNAPPGSPCSRLGYVCSGGSYCAPDGICRCPVDQTVANNTCIGVNAPSSANPGSPCTATTACLGDSTCVRNYCICGQFKLVNTQGRCVNVDQSDTKEVLPGSACPAASAPCQRNSVCENGYCICRATTINIGGSCVTTPTTSKPIGSSCIDSSECTSGAVCRNGNCLCPNGYRNQEGRCVPIDGVGGRVPIGGQCALESDCAGGAGCLNQRCACTDGKTASASGVCVLRQYSVPPGSWCSNEGGVTCHGGAECYRNTCSCPFGHIMINLQCSEAPVGQIAHAEPCDPNRCRLPNCFCSRDGAAIPGGLSAAETPQMVVLTFDDAVTDRTINIYKSLFDGRFKNPNGCPIKGTFFISHEWNNYDQTQWLYTNEHEIGVNSITHETLATEPVARWDAEMDGMRDALRTFSFVDTAEVVGVRAPQLSVGGESQFEMMRNRGFLYDNSMSANPGSRGRPFWPQTLDYSIAWNCEVKPCPVRSYPGIWTIPINQFYGYYLPEIEEHKRAAMVRAAMKVDDSPINVLGMLRENFRRAYESNRAPYVLTLNTDFLTVLPDNGAVTAIEQFLAEILNKTDVYVVTGRQAIEWVRQPTPLSSIRSFEPWACHRRLRADVQPCESSEPCRYDTRLANGVHSFRTCGSCPSQYPWLYDPTGKGNVRT
uniref:EGF-like domain-containing protein n=1 Tax=Plectus sambesii TaxID=2011161 RepID=A0A914VG41_9BILA